MKGTHAAIHCTRCGAVCEFGDFARDKSKASGRKSWCKPCDSARYMRYYAATREAQLARQKQYRDKNREQLRQKQRARYATDPAYREKTIAATRAYGSERYDSDPIWRTQPSPARRRGSRSRCTQDRAANTSPTCNGCSTAASRTRSGR